MTVKPVKFISDVQTKKQIIKTDISGNVLFAVSGTLAGGHISSSFNVTASGLHIPGDGYVETLTISGSDLPNLGVSGSAINVYEALSAVDGKFPSFTINETHTGSFDAGGSKNVQLTNFVYADLDNVLVDVLIKESGTTTYRNYLIDYELSGNIGTDKIHVLLTAPALSTNDSYRVIAGKPSGSA
jgi:hypothetical protein